MLWEAKIEGLRNAAKELMDVADKRDVKGLFEASADVDMACEELPSRYWYQVNQSNLFRSRPFTISR